MLAEALAAPPTHRALDLSAETAVLCTAASEAVRRRPGWLYVMPSPAPLPVALPRNLWQAAVLCVLRCVLPAGRARSRCSRAQGGGGGVPRGFRLRDARRHPALAAPRSRAYRRSLLGHWFPRAWAQRGRSPSPTFCRRSAPAAGPPRYPA
ncbi:MAG: hypothetical protein EP147_17210 [Subdoligranulum sp.]|nr:hypothetical protein [Subdoligranulum sp.]